MNILSTGEITTALSDLLTNAAVVGGADVAVERSGIEPDDPPAAGWLGIYRVEVTYPARALGAGNAGRSHRIQLLLIASQIGSTAEDCEDRLELLCKNTLDTILENGSFGGTVDTIEDVAVRYPNYNKTEDGHFRQNAYIFLTGFKSI